MLWRYRALATYTSAVYSFGGRFWDWTPDNRTNLFYYAWWCKWAADVLSDYIVSFGSIAVLHVAMVHVPYMPDADADMC